MDYKGENSVSRGENGQNGELRIENSGISIEQPKKLLSSVFLQFAKLPYEM
jgi:hypothetical protein